MKKPVKPTKSSTPKAVAKGDIPGVRQAAAQFYKALNAMFTGELEPMKQVWSHAKDVTYMGPGGGYQIGWSQVLPNWEAQAAMKLGGKVVSTEARIIAGQDVACIHNIEQGEVKGPDGKLLSLSIRATSLYRKEAGAWKMIGHHTDLLPFLTT